MFCISCQLVLKRSDARSFGGQKELANGIIHLHQADVRLVVSLCDVNSADDHCLHLFIHNGFRPFKIVCRHALNYIATLKKKNGVLCMFCNLNFSLNVTL